MQELSKILKFQKVRLIFQEFYSFVNKNPGFDNKSFLDPVTGYSTEFIG